jgi:hypothetical protein
MTKTPTHFFWVISHADGKSEVYIAAFSSFCENPPKTMAEAESRLLEWNNNSHRYDPKTSYCLVSEDGLTPDLWGDIIPAVGIWEDGKRA